MFVNEGSFGDERFFFFSKGNAISKRGCPDDVFVVEFSSDVLLGNFIEPKRFFHVAAIVSD